MTDDKLIEILRLYLGELTSRGIPIQELTDYTMRGSEVSRDFTLAHAAWMCVRAIELVGEGEAEKAGRWLGFIQNILWRYDIYTIKEMRDQSRS